jgi:hypothetical protein
MTAQCPSTGRGMQNTNDMDSVVSPNQGFRSVLPPSHFRSLCYQLHKEYWARHSFISTTVGRGRGSRAAPSPPPYSAIMFARKTANLSLLREALECAKPA